jgi:hypothetical protein
MRASISVNVNGEEIELHWDCGVMVLFPDFVWFNLMMVLITLNVLKGSLVSSTSHAAPPVLLPLHSCYSYQPTPFARQVARGIKNRWEDREPSTSMPVSNRNRRPQLIFRRLFSQDAITSVVEEAVVRSASMLRSSDEDDRGQSKRGLEVHGEASFEVRWVGLKQSIYGRGWAESN